ncbi:MAG: alpha-glucuronidase family glycosyl hydrolase [Rikenellaceae bacterium]|nr:alpha-glucuronidase family glycosyl hydrolase [Rikenellaceae bacterium]
MRRIFHRLFSCVAIVAPVAALAATGSDLWLPKNEAATTSMLDLARSEVAAIEGCTPLVVTVDEEWVKANFVAEALDDLGAEDYLLRSMGGDTVAVVGGSPRGALYGAYHLLRDAQGTGLKRTYDERQSPSYERRLLNHWDNLDGTVERGYAGRSIWWQREEPQIDLWRQYGRANASLGINGTVLNNVNASPEMLSRERLEQVKLIADVLRPYGVQVYLSINFSSPAALGGLPTSDPLDKRVRRWWKQKVKEIYALVPDFGGFLVKANSEGLPGPQDFGRSHADGANMLAEALAPYRGIVMWRAFVYAPSEPDRAKQAYDEFMPLDGKFLDNVIVQVKNGPVDFQPREPFSPLFGAMRQTPVMAELQITQEYLGFSNHLVYLAPLFEECLDADTYQAGVGSTVARATDGNLYEQSHTAIAGVANIGLDANWCGHHFAQANWYAFGRLAWDVTLSSEEIAREWLCQTFTAESAFVEPMTELMMRSREACVDYMMPMGLHHLFAWGHHYGPEPWCAVPGARPDWLPSYYHKADKEGIGFDRSSRGSGATAQYAEPLRSRYDDPATCPEELILWFHHLPWDYPLASGQSLWEGLCRRYERGLSEVWAMRATWQKMRPYVDAERFEAVNRRLTIQCSDALWWKDACLLYFQSINGLPFPEDVTPAVHRLEELKKIRLNMTHHN